MYVCGHGERMTTFDLFSAVRDGNTEIVRRLLQTRQCRARLNDRNEWGDTALHLAAEAGNTEICQMLKAAGASVTVRNNRGETCLHRSAVGGHVEACRAIVGKGSKCSDHVSWRFHLSLSLSFFLSSPSSLPTSLQIGRASCRERV